MKRALHIILVLLLAASCLGPRRIPRDEMEDIFYEMLLQEQFVRSDATLRKQMDTLLIYEGIFQKYGYDTDDFLYSLDYYIQEPDRLAKVMGAVADRLTQESTVTTSLIRYETWKDRMMGIWRQKPDTTWPRVSSVLDSLILQMYGDSIRIRHPRDTMGLDLPADSLLFYHPADSL